MNALIGRLMWLPAHSPLQDGADIWLELAVNKSCAHVLGNFPLLELCLSRGVIRPDEFQPIRGSTSKARTDPFIRGWARQFGVFVFMCCKLMLCLSRALKLYRRRILFRVPRRSYWRDGCTGQIPLISHFSLDSLQEVGCDRAYIIFIYIQRLHYVPLLQWTQCMGLYTCCPTTYLPQMSTWQNDLDLQRLWN